MPKEAKESMRISLTKKKKKRISTKYIDISKRNSNYRVEKYIKWKENYLESNSQILLLLFQNKSNKMTVILK